ncbi:hypothetical protein HPB48_016144 [Haemaphysalis longicornis]|uniref:Uncharacterized protein n=1 Tax=Haemaphysalis longicornis TaxID=44386 RepID=A0A9J6GH90_HAELO|nr:hypothetical protein HPB48_016144 [Haemaphysalis longicornis]
MQLQKDSEINALKQENELMRATIQNLTEEIAAIRKERQSANAASVTSPPKAVKHPTPVAEEDDSTNEDQHSETPAPKKRALSEPSFKKQTRAAIRELRAEDKELKPEIQEIKETLTSIKSAIEAIMNHPIFTQYAQVHGNQGNHAQPNFQLTWPQTHQN